MVVLCLVLVLLFWVLCLSSFAIILMGTRDLVLYFVFLMSYDSHCSVALPHGAVGWSALSDCGISLSLFFSCDETNISGEKQPKNTLLV